MLQVFFLSVDVLEGEYIAGARHDHHHYIRMQFAGSETPCTQPSAGGANPGWFEQIWLPFLYPTFGNRLTLELWRKGGLLSGDILLATSHISLDEITKGKGRLPPCPSPSPHPHPNPRQGAPRS